MILPTRRSLLTALLAAPVLSTGHGAARALDPIDRLPLTPSCAAPVHETQQQTEGPFFRPNSPERSTLGSASSDQMPLSLCGFVLDVNCRPVSGAIIEIWHADQNGEYDNAGFAWRGHQRTDRAGRWGFDTITTHHYAFRTAHYHFRVQAPGGELLTTQLYFPDHPRNANDALFDQRLVMTISADQRVGRYDFVVPA